MRMRNGMAWQELIKGVHLRFALGFAIAPLLIQGFHRRANQSLK